ncbi:MAG: DNA-3-methyladenine glycosylase [Verrucomicrobiota bacterium]
MSRKLPLTFYRQPDVVATARALLGQRLCVRSRAGLVRAVITETEAYGGAEDKGCHGYGHRRTARTEPLFANGGISYVYLCYGLHHLFNVVTGPAGEPMAVLVRAVRVRSGDPGEAIVARRRRGVPRRAWSNGPGKVGAALGISTRAHNRLDLTGDRLWLETTGQTVPEAEIEVTPRIGIDYAAEWAAAPRRFVWREEAGHR